MSIVAAASDVFTRMLFAIDCRDWQGVRDAFADHVDLDYSSLFGVPAATVASDEQVGGWRAFAGAFEVTQHVTGPIVAAERKAEIVAGTHVRAYHRIAGAAGGDTWMVAGHYQVRLVHRRAGWRIIGLTLKVFYQDGNLDLPKIAQARAETPRPIVASS